MKVVHLLRKPCSEGTVAANVLHHGTGALNVDATRIGTTDNLNGGAYAKNASERHDKAENWRYKRGDRGGLAGTPFTQPTGRWPANLVLQHLDGCVQDEGCAPGCPVAGLDAQSGVLQGRGNKGTSVATKNDAPVSFGPRTRESVAEYNYDAGGASRFFKQVGGVTKPPTDG